MPIEQTGRILQNESGSCFIENERERDSISSKKFDDYESAITHIFRSIDHYEFDGVQFHIDKERIWISSENEDIITFYDDDTFVQSFNIKKAKWEERNID